MSLAERARVFWRDLRLAPKVVGVSVALLLLVQIIVFSLVRIGIDTQARVEIAKELATGERVWRRLLQQNAAQLREGALLLASDYGFRSAVASGDKETAQSALENHGHRIGAAISAYFDTNGRLVAHSDMPSLSIETSEVPVALQEVGSELTQRRLEDAIAFVGRTPFQFVRVPVRAPVVVGWVLMGFPIDQRLADDMFALFGVHVAVVGRALDQAVAVAGVGAAESPQRQLQLLSLPAGQSAIVLDDERYLTRVIALNTIKGSLSTVLLRSVDEVMAPYVRLQWLLAAVTALGVMLFAMVSWLATRRVTQPLNALTRAVRALELGEAEVALSGTDRNDELGRLARGFDAMRQSLAQQRAEIFRLAFEDPLTGLPNRARFRLILQQTLRDRPGQGQVAVLSLNLNRFKHINHVLGYAFGDAVLQATAQRLRQVLQDMNVVVARLGGDEFCILLAEADAEQSMALADRVAFAFHAPLILDGQAVDLSVGIGVAVWPEDAQDADVLLGRAEIAMRAAKARALGLLRYDPSLDVASSQTLSLLSDLRRAVECNELQLYLQPKIDVRSRQVVAAEGLVRWLHPQRGLVPPLQFIPFAEQTGFVRELTRWMFDEVGRNWGVLQQSVYGLRVAINLSTRDLMASDLVDWLEGWIRKFSISPEYIGLEITESAIMDDPKRAEEALNCLARKGFRLAIDDFGTGYSSLAYLRRLPVQELKIDRSFVAGMVSNTSDATIVRSTVDLAHNLGLKVVAEGVENSAILDALATMGCDEAQGYFISRPIPVSEWNTWCRDWIASSGQATSR